MKQPWADVNGYDSLSNANDDDMSVVSEEEGVDERIVNQPEGEKIKDEKDSTESFEMKGL